jgi:hypothetical protein
VLDVERWAELRREHFVRGVPIKELVRRTGFGAQHDPCGAALRCAAGVGLLAAPLASSEACPPRVVGRDPSQSRRAAVQADHQHGNPAWEVFAIGMLAELVDYVIGVDTHRDTHSAAVVAARSGAVDAGMTFAANPTGYKRVLRFADHHASGPRVWAVESSGSFVAGLATCLLEHGEWVV